MEQIPKQTVVSYKGMEGISCGNLVGPIQGVFSHCNLDETAVLFFGDGIIAAIAVKTDELKVIELEKEIKITDIKKCGGGRGKDCCIFLRLVQKLGSVQCIRCDNIERKIAMTQNHNGGERIPTERYPGCQI
ncbi:MAG: hypothetical protein WC499_00575 [Patescibacteria group bacterium]